MDVVEIARHDSQDVVLVRHLPCDPCEREMVIFVTLPRGHDLKTESIPWLGTSRLHKDMQNSILETEEKLRRAVRVPDLCDTARVRG